MKKKIFYFFAHQDDELGIFIQIKKEIKKNELFIFYLTSGTDEKINKNKLYTRDKESLKTLISLGVKKKNIFFIGRKLGIKHNKLHDTCNLIARRIKRKFKVKNCFQFSLYNAFKTSLIFFKVFNPIKKNGKKVFASLSDRIYVITLLFNYKSQIKIWIGLYPFIIFHYLIKGYNFIENLDDNKIIKKPHSGKLLYEKRKFCKFEILKKKTNFLMNN